MASEYLFFIGLIALFNYVFAFMLTIEISGLELMPAPKKFLWCLLVWLVPIFGPVLTHKYLKIGWAKGGSNHGGDGGFGGFSG